MLIGGLFCMLSSFAANITQKEVSHMTSLQSIQFTPAWPHGDIREIFPDVFFVTGTQQDSICRC